MDKAVEMLRLVGIPSPEKSTAVPFSAVRGMRQRVMIAMALACNPDLLIADEPTTALDVTIQAQILELMKELQRKLQMSIILSPMIWASSRKPAMTWRSCTAERWWNIPMCGPCSSIRSTLHHRPHELAAAA